MRRVASTCTARIADKSIMNPSSLTALPAMLCPPPRTDVSSEFSRAKRTAVATSCASIQRAMRAGRRSTIAFQIVRASS